MAGGPHSLRGPQGLGMFRDKFARKESGILVPAGTVVETGTAQLGATLDLEGAVGVLIAAAVSKLSATELQVAFEGSLDGVTFFQFPTSLAWTSTGAIKRGLSTYWARWFKLVSTLTGGTALATPVISGATPEGSGGLIPSGKYKYVVTALDAAGETVASNEVTATVVLGEKVKVAWAEVVGATGGYRVYRSPVGGGAGSENVFQTTAAEAKVVSFVDGSASGGTAGTPPAKGQSGADAVIEVNLETVRDRKPGGVNNK